MSSLMLMKHADSLLNMSPPLIPSSALNLSI